MPWGPVGLKNNPKFYPSSRRIEKKVGSRKSIRRNNGWKYPKFAKDIPLHIQETEQTLKRKKSKISMPGHIMITALKTKHEGQVLKADKWHNSERRTPIQMTADFSSETMEGQKEVAQYFSRVERKELSNMNSKSSEVIPQEWRRNINPLRWWKTKRICH